MSALRSIIKIDLDDRQDVFLFCNYEPAKKLNLYLLDLNNCKAFTGYATEIDLISQAAVIKMIFNDFLSLTTKALTQTETDYKFLYSLEKNCENFIFRWKSIDSDETIISIGKVKVAETDYKSAANVIFSFLSDELTNLNKKVLDMEKELFSARKEKDDAIKFASDITNMKEQVENELYSKFVLILNEKKEKIRSLKRHSYDSSSSDTESKKRRNCKQVRVHQISESSDDAEYDMGKIDVAGPSNSKRNISLPFLDDNEERQILPSPSKKRIRQRQQKAVKNINFQEHKKQTIIADDTESEDELMLNM